VTAQRPLKETCPLLRCVVIGSVQDPVGLNLRSEKWQDVNVVISLLKLFLRKLPESLVTSGKCSTYHTRDLCFQYDGCEF